MELETILDLGCELAEGPVWDEREQVLWWVNIPAGEVHRYDPTSGADRVYEIEHHVGSAGLRVAGGLVLATAAGFALLDTETGQVTPLTDPESDRPGNRFNEGKPGPDGAFWAGTMAYDLTVGAGALYRLAPDGTAVVVLPDVSISNGLAWSVDENTLYFIDTLLYSVRAFDFDRETGQISNQRIVINVDPSLGYPDGMTIDTEGKLWIAHFRGGAVRRWDPGGGELLQSIALPASRITSCTFGGPNLDELYITSAREGLSDAELTAEPLAGALFRVKTSFQGCLPYRFG